MRFRVIATSCLLIAVSAGSVTTLAANPDCSRWIREYQDALAKRSVAAKRHVVHAARHLGVPRPKLLLASVPTHKKYTPKLSPAEMLKRFKILCGEDLPDDAIPAEFIPTGLETELVQPAFPDAAPFSDAGITPVAFTPVAPAVVAGPAAPIATATPIAPFTPFIPVAPFIPTGGTTGTGTTGTGTTGTGTTGTGTTGTGTTGTGTTGTTPSPVPEPSTLILLLTGGSLAIMPALLRRYRRLHQA